MLPGASGVVATDGQAPPPHPRADPPPPKQPTPQHLFPCLIQGMSHAHGEHCQGGRCGKATVEERRTSGQTLFHWTAKLPSMTLWCPITATACGKTFRKF